MAEERVQRRLTAILACDVAGYSRLIGEDEEGTLARLKAHRREWVDPTIGRHSGRIVKTTGDGILIEFASIVDAVRCAVAIQRGMAQRDADVPAQKRIEYRIGVHAGDIVIEDDDIFGDGVNIAARLEGIADPGGICISDDASRQVRGKLAVEFEDRGNQQLKNIAEPVRVYAIHFGGSAGTRPGSRAHPALPDKPSIAVLPFDNMSAEPGQDYLADGFVESITAALSRIRSFFVIARNSAFAYKGRAKNVRDIGRELGVAYVIEGSVQKGGNRLRITVQMVETETGAHVWAQRYDGTVDDIFDLQDRIAEQLGGRHPAFDPYRRDRALAPQAPAGPRGLRLHHAGDAARLGAGEGTGRRSARSAREGARGRSRFPDGAVAGRLVSRAALGLQLGRRSEKRRPGLGRLPSAPQS